MNTDTLSIEALKGYLSSQYKGWSSFVDNVIFPIFGKDKFETLSETELLENNPEEKPLAEATGICSIKQVGQIDIGVQPLQIFDVTVSDRVMMERNRVNIQRLIRKVMENYSSAFMLFHYENDTRWDWRFTFCHKKGSQKEVTDSKRYTFLLGPGQSCRTAAENFIKLYENRDTLDMSKIEGAFSVEALTNEFFGKYKEEYDKFVEYITGKRYVKRDNKYVEAIIHEPHPTLYPCFSNNDKLVRDYVKKMLGRIVFLHFLQKKGWLGVPYNEEWGNGDRNFMLNLFKNATEKQKENFLDEVLEGLFAEGLDCNRAEKSEDFSKPKIIYPNMTKYMPFVFDNEMYLTNQKCFIITGKYVAYLTAFFNSSLFKYCFRDSFPELQGGTRELSKIFFDKIPVYEVSDAQNLQFQDAVEDIQKEYTKQKAQRIDSMLFDLYNLSSEERATIDFVEIV